MPLSPRPSPAILGKKVMAEPYDVRCVGLLPVWDSTKEQAIMEWNRLLSEVELNLKMKEVVEDIKRDQASFVIKTDKGNYRAQRVLVAIGTRGKPRRLNVPGEDSDSSSRCSMIPISTPAAPSWSSGWR